MTVRIVGVDINNNFKIFKESSDNQKKITIDDETSQVQFSYD